MNKNLRVSLPALMLLAIIFTAFPASPAGAAGFIEVNSSADTSANDGACTLREAITAANTDASSGGAAGECAAGSGADEITFAGNYTIILSSALPQVNSTMTIDGTGRTVVIDGVNAYRVFDVGPPNGNLTINQLSISNGEAGAYTGGGIRNYGTLAVANSTFSNNAATWGGGISNESTGTISSITNSTFSGNPATSGGGGIHNGISGTITSITGTTFSGNSATSGDGGGLINYGAITAIANSTFSGNTASSWGGGGIINAGAGTITTIANSTFAGNSGPHGGGINNAGTITTIANTIVADSPSGGNCYGTAPGTSTNNLTDGSGCVTWGWANTLDPANHLGTLADNGGPTQTIALLPGAPAIDGGDNATCAAAPVNNLDQRGVSRPLGSGCDIGAFEYQPVTRYVATSGNDSANDCTNELAPCETIIYTVGQAANGDTVQIAAGTYTETGQISINKDLTVTGAGMSSTILDGGNSHLVIYGGYGYTSSIQDLTIQNGTTSGSGGGIQNESVLTIERVKITNNESADGGGISNYENLTIIDSAITGNVATNVAGGIMGWSGDLTLVRVEVSGNSASFNGGGIHYQVNGGTLTMSNVTISNNTGQVGGLYLTAPTSANITNSTITNNHPAGITTYGSITISNNILAGNDDYQCYSAGSWTSNGYNISSDASCSLSGINDQENTDPLLAALANHGGYSQTHALQAGSPAIDAGDNTACAAPPVSNLDQRGNPRPVDSDANGSVICDIGAFEYQHTITSTTLRSQKRYDGWILESGEFTKKGGSKNATGKTLQVGDDAFDKQYRAILSFGTAAIPDDAILTKATLKIKKQGVAGSDPMGTHNGLVVDIKKTKFSTLPALQVKDFQAKANKFKAGVFPNTLFSGWYRSILYNGAIAYINVKGRTQLRLRFILDDNDNNSADILKLYSGNAILAKRPKLIVKYYVP